MKKSYRLLTFTLLLLLLGGVTQTADAQGMLGRIKKKAQDAAGTVAGKATDAAVDAAADKAADKAVQGVENAMGDGQAEGQASGQAGVQTTGATGAGANGAASGMANLGNAMGAMMGTGGGGAVETVDFRELRALLPESLPRMARSDARGQKSAAFGISTSNATGSYATADGSGSLNIQITDMGSMRSFAAMGQSWAATEMDVETDNGYERTVKYKNFPGYEKFEKGDDWSTAELQVVVGERFLVSVEGSGVEIAEVRAALDQIDVAKLDGMKDFGIGAGVEPMDFQILRDLLPASAAGLERTNATGQKSNAMGVYSSYAEAQYRADNASLTVKITDLGTMQGIGALGYGWLSGSMETETDTGYERTGKYKDFPSHEKFEKNGDSSSAQLDVVVNQRFVVSAQGNGVTMEQVKAAVDAIDLSQLQAPAAE